MAARSHGSSRRGRRRRRPRLGAALRRLGHQRRLLLERRLNVLAGRFDVGAHILERIVALDVVRDVVDLLLEVGHFRFAHRFLELALEFGGHAAHLPGPLSERAQDRRQFLRPDHDQRDDADEQELGPRDIEHGNSPAGSPRRSAVSRRESLPVGEPQGSAQDTLLSASARRLTSPAA